MKALELLLKQVKENYDNRPFFCSDKKFLEYFAEKEVAFWDAIDELRDFLTEYQKLKENAKYIQNDTFNDDHDYIPYRTLKIKVSIASILEEIKKLKQDIEYIYQTIHNLQQQKSK